MLKSILNGVTIGSVHWAKVHDPTIVEGDCWSKQEVCVTTGCMLVQMHVTDWTEAQRENPTLSTSLGLAEGTEKDRFEDNFW